MGPAIIVLILLVIDEDPIGDRSNPTADTYCKPHMWLTSVPCCMLRFTEGY